MVEEIEKAFDQVESNPNVRAVVLTELVLHFAQELIGGPAEWRFKVFRRIYVGSFVSKGVRYRRSPP